MIHQTPILHLPSNTDMLSKFQRLNVVPAAKFDWDRQQQSMRGKRPHWLGSCHHGSTRDRFVLSIERTLFRVLVHCNVCRFTRNDVFPARFFALQGKPLGLSGSFPVVQDFLEEIPIRRQVKFYSMNWVLGAVSDKSLSSN